MLRTTLAGPLTLQQALPVFSPLRLLRSCAARLLGVAMVVQAGLAGAQEALPDFYKESGISPNRAYVNQSFNEHIDPFTGALQLHYVDIHLPGNGGFDLSVARSYHSSSVDTFNPARHEGIAGVGWTVHFGRVLKKDTLLCSAGATVANNPVLELPDGSRQLLAFTGLTSPLALTTQRWKAECIAGGMAVYSPDGTRYDMTQLVNVGFGTSPMYAWYTTRITDRNGNSATVNYAATSSPQIASVIASDGRSINFTYLDSGLPSRRVSTISAAGQTYTYGYTAIPGVADKYNLTSVTRPGSSTWGYSYNDSLAGSAGGYLLRQVRYPQGGTVSYTYGEVYFDTQANPSSRSSVITNKTLSSGGTWTFAYAPGSPSAFDTTTVNTPSGTITYRHVGPNYSSSGTVWMVGLLMSRQVGSVLTETNVWDKQKISSQNNFRPGAFVLKVDTGAVNAPILTSRTIVQNGAAHTSNYSGFDAYGNPGLVTESGPNGGARSRSLTYNYNTSKWIVQQVKDDTVSGGVQILRSIDSNGNVLSVTRDGVVTSHGYDSQGNISSTTFPRSLTHTYSAYRRGIAQVENQPEGISISRVVSDAGNVTSETNGEQQTTNYAYDGLNRVFGITPPSGTPTTIAYTATSKTATRGALTETTSYDGFGRPASITLGGIARSYQHDALGRMTFASNPGASVGTSYQYDMLDRVTRITNADNTLRAISFGAGSKTITDERSNATRYNYRSYGDPAYQALASVVAPDASANVSISLNGRDLIDSITQAGLTRTMGYNTAGHLTSVTNPETGTTTYGRDPAGNMTSSSVGASGTTTYSYDGQNRMSSVTYPGTPQAVTHTYTRTGKMKSVAAASATKGFSYDSNDNLNGESIVVDGLTFATGYGYNGLDQLSTIAYPRTGRVVSYAPSPLGRPTQVSGFAPSISYWPSGLLQQINYANGAVSRYSQHASRLWPSGFSTTGNATTYINSTYVYDGVGNLNSISDVADPAYNRNFGYDAINRLTSASGPWGSGTIAYNGAGNIVQQTYGSSGLSYAYSAQNRLSSVTGVRVGSFGYDARGNITSAPGATYAYDGAPNLTCANCSDAAQRTDYAYDGMNRRVSATKGGIKTYEVYGFNGNLLLEYSPASGGKLVEYVYLGGKRIAQVQTGGESSTTEIFGATSATVGSTLPYTIYVNPAGGYAVVKLNGQVVGQGQAAYRQICPIVEPPILCKAQAPTLTVPITFTASGVHTVTAEFAGDSFRLPSSIAHLVTVASDPSKTDPTPPSLSFANCSSVSSTAPTPATMTCTLSNSGQTAASSVGYNTAAGTAVSGPSGSCAAGAICGTVTVTTGTAAGSYSGTLTATPNTGSAASRAINLVVNAATGGGEWIYCGAEWGTCQLPSTGNWEVRFGPDSSAVQSATLTFTNVSSVGCSNSVFGDPAPGIVKQCFYKNTASAPPPALSLSGCSSNSPSVAPAAATMTCSLSNTGSAAGSISYAGAAGTTVSGPTGPCAAGVTCGTVTVTTGTAAGTYSGTLTATPNTGSAASQAINLVVNAATAGGEWVYCGAEWATCQLPSTGNWEVRYGPDSSAVQSATLAFTNVSSVGCSNSVFGDPAPGSVKSCYYRAPPPVWTLCASEWGTCVLPAAGNYTVLYGPNLTSTQTVILDFRDVSSVSCSNGVFGDPAPGIVKNCYYRR